MRALFLMASIVWCASLVACSGNTDEPVVVHVFRDRDVIAIDSALLQAGAKQLTVAGRPILIATLEHKSYADGLAVLGQRTRPQVIFFNSRADCERLNIYLGRDSAVNVSGQTYYLVIPPWAEGKERQAAEVVVASLRQELSKAPSTAPTH